MKNNQSVSVPIFVNVYGAILPSRQIPPVNTSASEVNVELGNISASALRGGVGDTAATTSFNLKLSNYPKTEKYIYITLNGAFTTEKPYVFSYDGGKDMGAAVFISDDFHNTPRKLAHPGSLLGPYPLVEGEVNIKLLAGYIAVDELISSGTVNLTLSIYAYTQSQLTP